MSSISGVLRHVFGVSCCHYTQVLEGDIHPSVSHLGAGELSIAQESKSVMWASEIAQWIKALVVSLLILVQSLDPSWLRARNNSYKLFSPLHTGPTECSHTHTLSYTHTHTHTHTHTPHSDNVPKNLFATQYPHLYQSEHKYLFEQLEWFLLLLNGY